METEIYRKSTVHENESMTEKTSQVAGKSIFSLVDCSATWGIKLWKVIFDLPDEKVNKLNLGVMEQFGDLLSRLEEMGKQNQIDVLVLLSGKAGGFIAGADITMLQAAKTAQDAELLSQMGHKLMNRWEDLPCPTVAAVNGAALGGGLEFCLASSAIVVSADSSAKLGLPEVMLGLIPGMGGCVRLPRKVGLATSLDLILTGKTLSGERALKAGMIEACLPMEDFENSVFRWAKANLNALQSGKRLAKEPKLGGMGGAFGTFMEKTPFGRKLIFTKAREGVMAKTKGHYPAPLEALDTIQEMGGAYGVKLKGEARDQALAREAKGFGKVASSQISKNLMRIFFMTEGVKKSTGLMAGKVSTIHSVKNGAVLGAGVMGGGIAQLLAAKEIPVRMKDLSAEALAAGISVASKIFQKEVKKKKINSRTYLQKLNLIAPVLDYSGFRSADLVVEAIVEKMDVKKKAFQELEGYVRENCIIASNTSSLSINEMQRVLKNPERFVGLHFFNPVHKMPLVEVIRGEKTSDEAVATVFQMSKRLGKTPIVVKDAPGFLVNRLLMPYLNEATWLLGEGVPIVELDQVLLDFGMPMGPLELIDEVGVDVAEKVAHIFHEAFGERASSASFQSKVVEAGRMGKKSGKGFYVYSNSGREKELDSKIYEIINVMPQPGVVSAEEILERCMLPMINEASRCLEEGLVSGPSDVDLGMIMGTGFPPFRGGLLRYADELGVKRVVELLRKYEKRFGARFSPSPALLRRAEHENEKEQRFYSH